MFSRLLLMVTVGLKVMRKVVGLHRTVIGHSCCYCHVLLTDVMLKPEETIRRT